MHKDPFFRDGWYILYFMGWGPIAAFGSIFVNYSLFGRTFWTVIPILLFMSYLPFLIVRMFKQ